METELLDKLGIPTARLQTTKKVWLDSNELSISPAGAEHISVCPLRIGIVSTGLIMRDSNEKQHLLDLSYGLVILDEAHKAPVPAKALPKMPVSPMNCSALLPPLPRVRTMCY